MSKKLNLKKMKNHYFSLLIICLFSIVGCKNENTDTTSTVTDVEETIKQFKVKVNFIAAKKDDFCLLYTEDNTVNFGENGVWKSVEGSENEQQVEFELPEDVYPTHLRLDLGIKSDQSDITLKSVILEYNGNTKYIAGQELGIYFRADENTCTFDPITGIVKSNVENGVKQNPSLYPQEPTLKLEIEKLMKQ